MSGANPLRDNAYGIDVSHWQDTTPSLAGLDFLFARATIGTQPDETYAMHISRAKRAGLVTGAYHFGDLGTTPAKQAAAFLKAAGDVDLYFLDHEGVRQMTDAGARAFVKAVQAAGHRCGLYASLSGFPDFGQDFNWIALWASNPPTRNWTFWQFGGSGVDHDVFNGSAADLRAFVGGQPSVGLNLTFIDPPETGILTIPPTADAQSVATGLHAPSRAATIQRWAVKVRLDVDGVGDGYLVDLANGLLHFIRQEQPVTFAPTVATTQADIDAAVKAAILADRAKAKPLVTVVYDS